jgi:succinate-semialdehyde dehydrogenase/glutarate-semialdehyde dehydrogenase
MSREQTEASQDVDLPAAFQMYVGGEWCASESGETRTPTNPATGEDLGTVPSGTRADVQRAIDAAHEVQSDLEFRGPFERAELVHELGEAIEEHLDYLAEWLVRDQGKPLAEAVGELESCREQFHNAAEDVKRDETPTIPSADKDKRIFTIRKPHGVLGVITPWNFPLNIPAEYLAPGLAVGNAIVWCPAPTTSVVAVKLMEVFAETSLPDGAINLVTGEGPVVGNEIAKNDGVDAVGFTGSPETGEKVATAAGAKPTLLELGGNGPVIVLDDADLDAAAEAAAGGSFSNAGQICSASERILVHEDVREEFVSKLADHAADVSVGDPTDDDTDMGPLNNPDVAAKMEAHVRDAVEKGADLIYGGDRVDDAPSDLYFEPTVLDDVTPDMVVNSVETFGPIAPVIPISSYDEAVEIANDISLGLTSGVFTSNIATMHYFAERIETGLVNINDGSTYWEIHTPVGGYSGKDSGVGRIGGRFTLEEVSQLKNVIVDLNNVVGGPDA